MRSALLLIWPTVIIVVVGCGSLLVAWIYLSAVWGAPWVPSSGRTLRKMLRLGGVQPGQKVVDLGAGDGRIVVAAAREFGARAAGVEIDPLRCLLANTWILLLGLRKRAHVYCGDMVAFDLRDADVVTLFLLPGANRRLRERLSEQLHPGARVVSHSFAVEGWPPLVHDEEEDIFVYEMGERGA